MFPEKLYSAKGEYFEGQGGIERIIFFFINVGDNNQVPFILVKFYASLFYTSPRILFIYHIFFLISCDITPDDM
jgi:hypothetical protein